MSEWDEMEIREAIAEWLDYFSAMFNGMRWDDEKEAVRLLLAEAETLVTRLRRELERDQG